MPIWLDIVIRCVAVIAFYFVMALYIGYVEHKVLAHMQGRLGPMYAGGFHGWAQLLADAVKFLQKEDTTPASADAKVYRLAPAVAVVPYIVALTAIPLTPTIVGVDLDAGLVFVLAMMGVGVYGLLMAGWGSGSKYSYLGGMRAAGQLVAYELPMVLSAASVALAAGTLSLPRIMEAWNPWWLLWQAPGAFCFFVAALAELQRPPFDLPIADSEIVMGPYTEYTGLRFAFFMLGEYAGMVVMGLLFSDLFLGGHRGPFLNDQLGWLWNLIKVTLFGACLSWIRAAWPRLRSDVLQRIAWVWLVPLSLLQLAITAVVVVMMQ